MDKFYTTSEVADILKVDQETIRRYLIASKIVGTKIGNVWRISEENLKKFLEENSNI